MHRSEWEPSKRPVAPWDRGCLWQSGWRFPCAGEDRKLAFTLCSATGNCRKGKSGKAALSAGSFGLDNLCMIVDRNYLQAEGHSDRVVKMGPIPEKFESFGWNATEVDGNNLTELLDALRSARATKGKPFLINALTKTGAGVPFLEGQLSHVALLSPEDAQRALAHLEGQGK